MTKIALIPSYEPDESLTTLVANLADAGFETIVVDDGSGRGYANVFEETSKNATVITLAENHGKGYALKTGMGYIRENCTADSVVVTVDGDGQHSVKDAARCAEMAQRNPGTLVLGCRSFGKSVPLKNRMGNKITRIVYRLLCGIGVSDTQTGLRAFSVSSIPFLTNITGNRYEYEMNMLVECSQNGIPMDEVPIETIYTRATTARSHFSPLRDSFLIYRDLLKFAGSSFVSFLADYALYSLLFAMTSVMGVSAVVFSNVLARIGSATLNYTINRKFVFKSNRSVVKTAAEYFSLAAGILLCNTLVLGLLVGVLGMNAFIAKLVVEITFFIISWTMQRHVIFKKGREMA